MSNPTTPESSKSSHKSSKSKSSKSKSRLQRKRRHSNNSNASIISIDPVSLKSLRKLQEKVHRENKKHQSLYQQQKKSQFEDYTKKFLANELKEEDEYKAFTNPTKNKNNNASRLNNKYGSFEDEGQLKQSQNQMEDITVEELLPLIKNLVDRHNKLQTEYDILDRELREQKIVMEDKITQLEQQHNFNNNSNNSNKRNSRLNNNNMSAQDNKLRREYEDKMEILKNNYENNLLSIQSGYEQQIENGCKEIKTLNKELNDLDKEIDALRQSFETLEHENQSLRISMNNQNKQFQNIKLFKTKNKQLILENETLRQQIENLEQDIEILMQEQEQMEKENNENDYLNNHESGTQINPTQRPQTPSHAYTKTVMMGHRDQLEIGSVGSNKQSVQSENDTNANDLLINQIGNIASSNTPGDRDSNYDEYEDEDEDEKKINDNFDQLDHDEFSNDNMMNNRDTILANLSKFKRNIAPNEPDSMAQILQLLQEKEKKRLGNNNNNNNNNSQQSHDVLDNCSVASNYSDSEQELKEQVDNIEDDIRELKDMILSLMDSTNNVTPTINASLGPLIRKINRMYLMLSGPVQSRTDEFDHNGSLINDNNNNNNDMFDRISIASSNTKKSSNDYNNNNNVQNQNKNKNWVAWLTPYVNDWMPSVGFSAIILSTMYLLIKYHKGRFIGIGQPRVLRNKRGKLI